jgi:multiple sugar transport system permease protein
MVWRVILKRAASYTLLFIWSIVCVLPLYWVVLASLKGEEAIIHGPRYLPYIDFVPTFEAWHFILMDSHENLLRPFYNSFAIALTSTIIATALSCLMLYGLTRFPEAPRFKNQWLLWGVLASRILSPACLVIPLYMMAHAAGVLDTQSALIFTYSAINLPVAVWLLQPAFGHRATDQEEAAALEGASKLYVLWDILLPMMRVSIATVALIIFILCWNEYFFAAYLTTNHAATLTPWMVGQLSLKEAQIGGEPEEWAHLSAASVFMAAPLLVFAGVLQKFLSRRSVSK